MAEFLDVRNILPETDPLKMFQNALRNVLYVILATVDKHSGLEEAEG